MRQTPLAILVLLFFFATASVCSLVVSLSEEPGSPAKYDKQERFLVEAARITNQYYKLSSHRSPA
jgi:hypothetical protein